jgi:hypothetical protein
MEEMKDEHDRSELSYSIEKANAMDHGHDDSNTA